MLHIAEARRQIWWMQPSDWVQQATKYVPRKAVGHMQRTGNAYIVCLMCDQLARKLPVKACGLQQWNQQQH